MDMGNPLLKIQFQNRARCPFKPAETAKTIALTQIAKARTNL